MEGRPRGCPAPNLASTAKLFAAVFAASALTALAPGTLVAQKAEDAVAVREQVESYRSAWDTHEASAVASFFTDDADMVMGNLPAARGRQAIEDSWRAYFANQESERRLTIDVNAVRFVTPDVAVINVLTTTGGRDRQGQHLPARRFRGSWVVHRQSGKWMIMAMRGMPIEQDQVVLNASLDATETLKPQIRAFVDAYEDAFNSHDPSSVSAFYTNDADIIVRNGPVTHGRQAIQDWWHSYFAEPRNYRAILIIDEIRMITPNVALINVFGTGAVRHAGTQRAPVRYARATWVLVREDSEWLITALWVLPSEDDQIIRESDY